MSVDLSMPDIVRFAQRVQASLFRRLGRALSMGSCHCVYCGKNSPFFLPFAGGVLAAPAVNEKLEVIGSDLKRYVPNVSRTTASAISNSIAKSWALIA